MKSINLKHLTLFCTLFLKNFNCIHLLSPSLVLQCLDFKGCWLDIVLVLTALSTLTSSCRNLHTIRYCLFGCQDIMSLNHLIQFFRFSTTSLWLPIISLNYNAWFSRVYCPRCTSTFTQELIWIPIFLQDLIWFEFFLLAYKNTEAGTHRTTKIRIKKIVLCIFVILLFFTWLQLLCA